MGCVMATKEDEAREERIESEIVVDAYGKDERATGWYSYLQDTLTVPLLTRCVARRAISPLEIGDEVEVIGMAPEEECQHGIFVTMPWEKEGLAVPLSQLEVTYGDDQTTMAVEDWHYWVRRGYEF